MQTDPSRCHLRDLTRSYPPPSAWVAGERPSAVEQEQAEHQDRDEAGAWSGQPSTERCEGVILRSIVLHVDNLALPELDYRGCLSWPFITANGRLGGRPLSLRPGPLTHL
jgi:hypothetical protein